MSAATTHAVTFSLKQVRPHIHHAIISISPTVVQTVFDEISRSQIGSVDTHGFAKGKTPLRYIANHFKVDIAEQCKEFIFKYIVLQVLLSKLHDKKVRVAGEPRLREISLDPEAGATYQFDISVLPPMTFKEWKVFAFKAPKRKNYKDIDRQVTSLIQEEQQAAKKHQDKGITVGDWVCFDIALVNEKRKPLLKQLVETLWVKIGDEEADGPCRQAFLGKKMGERFYADHLCFQDYFCTQLDTSFLFSITIKDIVHEAYFDLDMFKRHFRLKTNKEMHKKMTEVFSFRNDISQRRVMAEDALKLIINKHPFQVPRHTLLRQIERVLGEVKDNPDYQVYRQENSFKNYVETLATKQAEEQIIVDQLALKERVIVSPKDVKAYMYFLQRPRMKEFLYFTPPQSKHLGQEQPISNTLIRRYTLREKTLNHVIFHLTKK